MTLLLCGKSSPLIHTKFSYKLNHKQNFMVIKQDQIYIITHNSLNFSLNGQIMLFFSFKC